MTKTIKDKIFHYENSLKLITNEVDLLKTSYIPFVTDHLGGLRASLLQINCTLIGDHPLLAAEHPDGITNLLEQKA